MSYVNGDLGSIGIGDDGFGGDGDSGGAAHQHETGV